MPGRFGSGSRAIGRREALGRIAGGLLAPGVLLSGCTGEGAGSRQGDGPMLGPLPPVLLDPSRIRRSYVCLRPFRPSGMRLEVEHVAGRRVVHNYGHGAGGVTLSWGTATMAADMLRADGVSAETEVAVVGCGVVGLSTALVLLGRGARVTIYTRDLPLDTTSSMAAANFYPSYVADPSAETPAFLDRIERACRISHRMFLERLPQARYGIRWRRQFFLTDEWNEEIEAGSEIYRRLRDLYPDAQEYGPSRHPFSTRHAFVEDNLFIEPPLYLMALLEDVRQAGGRIEMRTLSGPEDLHALPESVVMHCTGLGARDLAGDPEVRGLTGQHVFLEPQPEVEYAASLNGRGTPYVFPRSDGILLGLGEGEVVTPAEMVERCRALVPAAGGGSTP